MSDLLAALRRELHELECRAEAADGEALTVLHLQAAEVADRINTLEHADGLARGVPMHGEAA